LSAQWPVIKLEQNNYGTDYTKQTHTRSTTKQLKNRFTA